MAQDLGYYNNFLNMSYQEAVEFLLDKYGKCKDDYFKKDSYKKFFDNRIKSIKKGDISRVSEGLYCHHVYEDKFANLNPPFVFKLSDYPFFIHEKNELVYCNLLEHILLHTLIFKEHDQSFGFDRLKSLINKSINWYIYQQTPIRKWEKNCYKICHLTGMELGSLIDQINYFLHH